MCEADSGVVRHKEQMVLVWPPFFEILSAVQSLFCRSNQANNLRLFSALDFHNRCQLWSCTTPVNWERYADEDEYVPLAENLHDMSSG